MSDVAAEVVTTIDAPRAKVWRSLIDPADVRKYFMGATVATDWRQGGPITWSGEWQGKPFEDRGEILTIEPERRLRFSHWSPLSGAKDEPANYHVVDITLDAAGPATTVTLTQTNLEGGITTDDREHRDDYEKNWSSVLDGLKHVVEAR